MTILTNFLWLFCCESQFGLNRFCICCYSISAFGVQSSGKCPLLSFVNQFWWSLHWRYINERKHSHSPIAVGRRRLANSCWPFFAFVKPAPFRVTCRSKQHGVSRGFSEKVELLARWWAFYLYIVSRDDRRMNVCVAWDNAIWITYCLSTMCTSRSDGDNNKISKQSKSHMLHKASELKNCQTKGYGHHDPYGKQN